MEPSSYFSCFVVLLLPAVSSPSSTASYDKTHGGTTTSRYTTTKRRSAGHVDYLCGSQPWTRLCSELFLQRADLILQSFELLIACDSCLD